MRTLTIDGLTAALLNGPEAPALETVAAAIVDAVEGRYRTLGRDRAGCVVEWAGISTMDGTNRDDRVTLWHPGWSASTDPSTRAELAGMPPVWGRVRRSKAGLELRLSGIRVLPDVTAAPHRLKAMLMPGATMESAARDAAVGRRLGDFVTGLSSAAARLTVRRVRTMRVEDVRETGMPTADQMTGRRPDEAVDGIAIVVDIGAADAVRAPIRW